MVHIYSVEGDASEMTINLTGNDPNLLAAGYTSLVTVKSGDDFLLYAFNKATKLLDVYRISSASPWLEQISQGSTQLSHYAWDSIKSFVLGNKSYLMAYEKHRGHFEFYEVKSDHTLSDAYGFMNQRSWPTQNFSEVEPFVVTGLMYILGYSYEHGTVAIFSLDVIATSPPNIPPLNMLNVWYHQWARGWENFSFFQLGQANFFFKINKAKLNVNIDHVLDSPALGSVEIGSYLQDQLPNALDVTLACMIPWAHGEPFLATYDGKTQIANLYHIHADCQGWTPLHSATVMTSEQMTSYRLEDNSFILFYS